MNPPESSPINTAPYHPSRNLALPVTGLDPEHDFFQPLGKPLSKEEVALNFTLREGVTKFLDFAVQILATPKTNIRPNLAEISDRFLNQLCFTVNIPLLFQELESKAFQALLYHHPGASIVLAMR